MISRLCAATCILIEPLHTIRVSTYGGDHGFAQNISTVLAICGVSYITGLLFDDVEVASGIETPDGWLDSSFSSPGIDEEEEDEMSFPGLSDVFPSATMWKQLRLEVSSASEPVRDKPQAVSLS